MSSQLPQGEKITAAHIRRGLQIHFPHPDAGVVFEVAQSTGHGAHRHLDAFGMELWPSRGLMRHGIEIKISRQDYARELADPTKAEQIARFCDFFWIATPPGLLQPAELPHAWGLMEGGKAGMRMKKKALKTKAEPVTVEFLAAVIRAAGRGMHQDEVADALAEARDKLEAEYADKLAREAERLSTNNDDDARHWRELMVALDAVGPGSRRSLHGWDAKRYIATIKAVHQAGIFESHAGLQGLKSVVDGFSARLDESMKLLAANVPDTALLIASHLNKRTQGKKRT